MNFFQKRLSLGIEKSDESFPLITSRIRICSKMCTILFKIKKLTTISGMSKIFSLSRVQLIMFMVKLSEKILSVSPNTPNERFFSRFVNKKINYSGSLCESIAARTRSNLLTWNGDPRHCFDSISGHDPVSILWSGSTRVPDKFSFSEVEYYIEYYFLSTLNKRRKLYLKFLFIRIT